MILKVYSVFDSKLATFDRPFFMLTDAAAIRGFSDAVNDPQKSPVPQWHAHPEDYSLYCLGVFDDQLGTIVSDKPVSLVTASSLVTGVSSAQLDFFDKNGAQKEPAVR